MSTDTRYTDLSHWLHNTLNNTELHITPASSDASFRRYFRIIDPQSNTSYIAMDAPPEHESCDQFIHIAETLLAHHVQAPEIIAQDLAQGFLLLSDFGDKQYLNVLNQNNVDTLYNQAIQTLIDIQKVQTTLPDYDIALLTREMQLFKEWYIKQHLKLELTEEQHKVIDTTFEALIENAIEQPQVFVHRDYHSRNIMYRSEQTPGILDFQDAVLGPITYDLVSLLKDCYIEWPEDTLQKAINEYRSLAHENNILDAMLDPDHFREWFDLMGMQRHIKVLGIFARLNYRDGKTNYLNDIPLTLKYVQQTSAKYPRFNAFTQLLNDLHTQ